MFPQLSKAKKEESVKRNLSKKILALEFFFITSGRDRREKERERERKVHGRDLQEGGRKRKIDGSRQRKRERKSRRNR